MAAAVAALVAVEVVMVVVDKLVVTTRVAAPEVKVVVASVVDSSLPGVDLKTFAVETPEVITTADLAATAVLAVLDAVLTT